jgi:trehalose 6-phosphate synthase/phosphatase
MNARGGGGRERLIVVSNRLPFTFRRDERGAWRAEPGGGGLVTALLPVLRNRGGLWIGWPGTTGRPGELGEALATAGAGAGYRLEGVPLTAEEIDKYYHGYSNEIIWPLFHDLQSRCDFNPEYWPAYETVNRKFAQALALHCHPEDFVWIHDYQLMDVARHTRTADCHADLAFFLHIPFPPPDIFMKLPERQAVLNALLAYDLVGVQTQRDRRNLIQCVRMLAKNTRVRVEHNLHVVQVDDREMRIGNFPIGIDAAGYAARAAAPEVQEQAQGTSGAATTTERSCWGSTGSTTPRAYRNGCGPSRTCSSATPNCADASSSFRWWYPAGWASPSTTN